MTNRAPFGVLSSTRISPPWSSMIRRAIASPRPLPFFLVEKFGATLPYYLSLTDEAEHLANQV